MIRKSLTKETDRLRPLPLRELLAHPGMKDVIIPPIPSQAGLLQAAKGRGGPFNINYEVHGKGPIHIVWIMGLRAPLIAWQGQVSPSLCPTLLHQFL